MTLPNLNTDQKSAAAGGDAYSISGDETRSTIGLHPSELAPSMISSTSHVAAIQSMKFAKTIALACLGLTVILGLFVMVNTGYQRCDCRYPSESGMLESRNNNPFFEPLVSDSTGDSNGKSKRLPIRIQMEGDASELMKKNKKGRVNCSVERKTATQIIASEPKLLITPYGNITTDPRIIHMVGEKMIFTCTTGKDKSGRNFKDKLPKKYGTVINLNELEKDEKAAANSIIGPSTTTTVPSEPTEARPKRSANDEATSRVPSKRVTCDCHCPHEG